jgi:UDP-glucose 4-epimerase
MKAVVTGAAGFIGSHVSERLLAAGHDVVGIDCFSDYYSRRIKEDNLEIALGDPNFKFEELDLVEDDLSDALDGADVVYHLASRSGIRSNRRNQFDHYLRDNVLATQRLLEHVVRHARMPRFVYAASSSMYGEAERVPTKESALPRPISPYGMTKLAGEHLVHMFASNFRLRVVSLRYFTVYGPRQRPDMAIARFMRALADGREVEVFGDGEQSREFTFVTDAVEATVLAAETNSVNTVFNIGGGSRATINQVLMALEEIAGMKFRRRHLDAAAEDHRHTGASINLARQQLRWEPRVSLRDGLELQWSWFQQTARAEKNERLPAVAV